MGRSKVKIVRYFLIGTLVLVMASIIVAVLRFPVYVKNHLSEWIANKSGNLYKLSFDDINLKAKGLSFSITGVQLLPDTVVARQMNEKRPGKIFYSFNSPEIQVNNFSLLQYITRRSFTCSRLKVVQPKLDLSGTSLMKSDSIASFRYIFRELQPLLNKKVREIKISEIVFEDAKYELNRYFGDSARISNAEKISVAIQNFRTDSLLASRLKMPFESDDIEIRINNFSTQMGDTIHITTIGSMIYSLRKSEVFASGFHLHPKHPEFQVSSYDVFVPEFRLKSKSIMNFRVSDSLMVDSLEFVSPRIKYFEKTNPRKIKIEDINNFDLFSLIKNQFRVVRIGDFYLNGASMEFYRQPDTINYLQRFNKIKLHLIEFNLDSLSGRDTENCFHARQLEMALSGYHLKLEDNIHEIQADSINVSTLTNRIGAKKIRIIPKSRNNITNPEIQVNCQEFSMENTDLKKLYHNRLLFASEINVISPRVKISYPEAFKKKEPSEKQGFLFEMVSAYLRGVYSDRVRVTSGLLNIRNLTGKEITGYFETGFNFRLTDFQLDSLSLNNPQRFFFARGFDLRFPDFRMKLVDNLHQLNASLVTISSEGNTATIDSLRLKPVSPLITNEVMRKYSRSEAFNIFVPQISLSGTNLHEAWFNNILLIDKFSILNPDISFESFGTLKKKKTNLDELYRLVMNYFRDIEVNHLEIPEGMLKVISHSKREKTVTFNNLFSASLDNFRFNEEAIQKERLLFADNFEITLNDQLFGLSDSVHFLKAGRIRFSTVGSAITVEKAQLYPNLNSKKYSAMHTTIQVTLPQIEMKGVDLNQVFRKKEVKVDTLNMQSPELEIFSIKKKIDGKNLKDFKIPVPALINLLQIGRLNLETGKVITFSAKEGKPDTTSSFNLKLNADNINYTKESELRTRDFAANVSGFRIKLSGNQYLLNFDELKFNKLNKNLYLSQVNLIPQKIENNKNIIALKIPYIEFTGFDAEKSLKTDNYFFDFVRFKQPDISVSLYSKKDTEQKSKPGIYQVIEPYANQVKAGTLYLDDARISVTGDRKPFQLDRFNMVYKNFALGKDDNSNRLFFSDEFEFYTGKIEKNSRDGIYRFSADSVTYHSMNQQLMINSFKMSPTLDKQQFEDLKGFQSDYVTGEIDRVTLSNPDIRELLGSNRLIAGSLKIGKAGFSVFRNKRLPFNQAQRPLMPVQLLRSVKTPFRFDSVLLAPSKISYSELSEATDKPGTITFNAVTVSSGKISNMEPLPQEIRLKATGRLMDAGKISAEFRFETSLPEYRHSVLGSLESMPLNKLNNMLENTSMVSVVSGNLNRFSIELSNNNQVSTGKLWFGYDDLRISVLKPDESGFRKAKLPSFLANSFLLPSKNPRDQSQEPDPVTIIYERDQKRAFFNYWWKAIFTGVKEVLGIKDKDRKK